MDCRGIASPKYILPKKLVSFLNCINSMVYRNKYEEDVIRMYFFKKCITKCGSLDRDKLDIYL